MAANAEDVPGKGNVVRMMYQFFKMGVWEDESCRITELGGYYSAPLMLPER
jgi:hypothetical protein